MKFLQNGRTAKTILRPEGKDIADCQRASQPIDGSSLRRAECKFRGLSGGILNYSSDFLAKITETELVLAPIRPVEPKGFGGQWFAAGGRLRAIPLVGLCARGSLAIA